jgi:hypothetical protein
MADPFAPSGGFDPFGDGGGMSGYMAPSASQVVAGGFDPFNQVKMKSV